MRRFDSDHARHEHCGCCGNCFRRRLKFEFCEACRRHTLSPPRYPTPCLGPHPWERTYFAQHGEPCPFQEAAA